MCSCQVASAVIVWARRISRSFDCDGAFENDQASVDVEQVPETIRKDGGKRRRSLGSLLLTDDRRCITRR